MFFVNPLIIFLIRTDVLSVLLPAKMLYHMLFKKDLKKTVLITVIQVVFIIVLAQPGVPFTKWTNDGNAYYQVEKGEIFKIELPSQKKDTFISKKQLTQNGNSIVPRSFQLSTDASKALIYTNAKKVWRYPTRGDYWLLTLSTGELKQLGKGRPASSLQFAKFSPDGSKWPTLVNTTSM